MIRKINKKFLDKAMTSVKLPITRMTYLQSSSILLILIIITIQEFEDASTLQIKDVFAVLWFIGEIVSSLLSSNIRQILNKNSQNSSIISIRKLLVNLKYTKFVNILCNFLSLLAQNKQTPELKKLGIDFYWSVAYIPLALCSLVIINSILVLYSDMLNIINNFEWEPELQDDEPTQAQVP